MIKYWGGGKVPLSPSHPQATKSSYLLLLEPSGNSLDVCKNTIYAAVSVLSFTSLVCVLFAPRWRESPGSKPSLEAAILWAGPGLKKKKKW